MKRAANEGFRGELEELSDKLADDMMRAFDEIEKKGDEAVRERVRDWLERAVKIETIEVRDGEEWRIDTYRVYVTFDSGFLVFSTKGGAILVTPVSVQRLLSVSERTKKILAEEVETFLRKNPDFSTTPTYIDEIDGLQMLLHDVEESPEE